MALEALEKAKQEEGCAMDFWGNDNPVCPHCGKENSVSECELYELYDEEADHEITCCSCNEEFLVSARCKWTFDTDEQV